MFELINCRVCGVLSGCWQFVTTTTTVSASQLITCYLLSVIEFLFQHGTDREVCNHYVYGYNFTYLLPCIDANI